MQKIKISIVAALLTISCLSCYRMPTEDDYCLVPATNNPAVTHEKPQGPIPQLKY